MYLTLQSCAADSTRAKSVPLPALAAYEAIQQSNSADILITTAVVLAQANKSKIYTQFRRYPRLGFPTTSQPGSCFVALDTLCRPPTGDSVIHQALKSQAFQTDGAHNPVGHCLSLAIDLCIFSVRHCEATIFSPQFAISCHFVRRLDSSLPMVGSFTEHSHWLGPLNAKLKQVSRTCFVPMRFRRAEEVQVSTVARIFGIKNGLVCTTFIQARFKHRESSTVHAPQAVLLVKPTRSGLTPTAACCGTHAIVRPQKRP